MQSYKSSAALKADARELLLGHYKTVILAYAIIQCITSGCLSFVESQSDFHSIAGNFIYFAVYLILALFLAVFTVGQYHMYRKLAKGELISTFDIWFAFRGIADTCMITQVIILARILLASVPFLFSTIYLVISRNYYFAPIVAFTCILFAVFSIVTLVDYSQAFFLVLDFPNASAKELLQMSHNLMKGHKARYFYMMVSFLGVLLLVALTFGIGMLWAYPYITATKTNFYLNLTNQEMNPDQKNSDSQSNTDSTNTTINLTV